MVAFDSGERATPQKDINGELLEELEATQAAILSVCCANYSNACAGHSSN